MRQLRIVTAAIATVAALLLALGSGSSATAHTPARVLPAHHITITGSGKYEPNHFYVKGFVTTAKGNRVFLLGGRSRSSWSLRASKRTTTSSGYFRFNFTGKVGTCFWLHVKKTPYRRDTVRKVGCIVRS